MDLMSAQIGLQNSATDRNQKHLQFIAKQNEYLIFGFCVLPICVVSQFLNKSMMSRMYEWYRANFEEQMETMWNQYTQLFLEITSI